MILCGYLWMINILFIVEFMDCIFRLYIIMLIVFLRFIIFRGNIMIVIMVEISIIKEILV